MSATSERFYRAGSSPSAHSRLARETIHSFGFDLRGAVLADAHPMGEGLPEAVHHLGAVVERESLRPAQVPQVRTELRSALRQVGEVRIGQLDPPLLAQSLGFLDVAL